MTGPIAELARDPLEWKAVGLTDRAWDLYAGGQRSGEMRVGALRSSAAAEIGKAKWKVMTVGLFGKTVVLAEGAHRETAAFTRKWYRGRVKFDTGRELEWGPTNFWTTRWAFTAENRQPLVLFRRKGFFRRTTVIELAPEARGMGELAVLLIIGQFLMIRRQGAH